MGTEADLRLFESSGYGKVDWHAPSYDTLEEVIQNYSPIDDGSCLAKMEVYEDQVAGEWFAQVKTQGNWNDGTAIEALKFDYDQATGGLKALGSVATAGDWEIVDFRVFLDHTQEKFIDVLTWYNEPKGTYFATSYSWPKKKL